MAQPRRIKTPGGWKYQADIRMKGFPRRTKVFDRKRDAVEWQNKTAAEMREGQAPPGEQSSIVTAEFVIDKFLNEMVDSDYKSAQYRKDLKAHLTWWKDQIGQFFLCNLNTRLLSDIRKTMTKETTRAPSTVNRYFSSLSTVFTKAVNEWEVMETNPVKSLKPLREPPGRTRWLTDDECDRLLTTAKRLEHKPIYELLVLAIATGARKTELLTIKKSNVLTAQKKIIIEDTKNRSNRSLYVDGIPLELVQSLMQFAPKKTYLFASRRGDNPITIDREWKGLLKAARIKNFRFHDLRHTAAAYLAMNGATLNEIAELLGHKTFNMTKRYAHIADSHLKGVSGKVQKRVFNQPKKD